MSKRNKSKKDCQESDDGMGTAGKVILGVAVAAAGAAIGYFGSRLLDSWLSNSEEVKGVDGSKDSEKPKNVQNNSEDCYHDTSQCGSACSSKHETGQFASSLVQQPSMSLHEQLLDYYYKYVDIPTESLQNATTLVEKVKCVISYHVRQAKLPNLPLLKIGELAVFGSTMDGLKVVRPDQFDAIIPVKFEMECKVCESSMCNGSVYIMLEPSTTTCADLGSVCDVNHYVVPGKLLSIYMDTVQRAITSCNVTPYQATLSLNECILSVVLNPVEGGQSISIEFRPAIIIDNKLFIPATKQSFSSQSTELEVSSALWNVSYSRQEKWAVDRFDSSVSGHMIVLKILKAIRLNHLEQFGPITSYHCKILLFHALEDLPDSCDWGTDVIGERLIDLLTRLREALSEHSLPHYFEQNTNLLQLVPQEACSNLEKFIEKKLGYSDITSLLKTEY